MGFNINQLKNVMNTPMMKSLMSSNDPKRMAINLLKNNNLGNPEIANNLIKMMENNDYQGIENYGKNLFASQGVSQDQINQMMNMFRN